MSLVERVVNAAVRSLFRLFYVMDIDELQTLPANGPGILLTNHTSNLEGPAYYVFMQPRPTTALGKRELWSNRLTGFFMKLWGIIPVSRGQVDTRAMRRCVRALDAGYFLGMAPEGTRSPSEQLREAQPGIALLAIMRRVPIYPVAHWGFRNVRASLRRMHRPRVVIRVGRPFRVSPIETRRPSASTMRTITDEMMFELARLLPESMRGHYRCHTPGEPRYLTFLDADEDPQTTPEGCA